MFSVMRLSLASTSVHANIDSADLVSVGCNKNTMQMTDITMLRLRLAHHFGYTAYSVIQISQNTAISTSGTRPVSVTLNKSIVGANAVTSTCGSSQSYDKNVSDVEPTVCTDPNICVSVTGNLTLNDIAADTSWM